MDRNHGNQEPTEPADGGANDAVPGSNNGTGMDTAVDMLKEQLDACRAESERYLDQWRRSTAEFSNYKKRSEREQAESVKYYNASLITRLLPIIDDLDLAFENLPPDLTGQPWIEGMQMIQRKLHATLEQEGVREISTSGSKFDPALHEAVTHEPSETAPEGHIIGEIRKGYTMNGRILRPAQVRVSAG